ncbi:MAG: hypothetical protein ABW198_06605, partial [Pseudorhodoplanes sp.]
MFRKSLPELGTNHAGSLGWVRRMSLKAFAKESVKDITANGFTNLWNRSGLYLREHLYSLQFPDPSGLNIGHQIRQVL